MSRDWRDVPRVAPISGYVAVWLQMQLATGSRVTQADVMVHTQWLREGGLEPLARQVESAWAQMDAAAEQYRERAGRQAVAPLRPVPVSDDGNAQAEIGSGRAVSEPQVEITTKEAAEMLGLSERRVGQFVAAGTLQGRKAGRAWLLPRSSVEMLRDARSAS